MKLLLLIIVLRVSCGCEMAVADEADTVRSLFLGSRADIKTLDFELELLQAATLPDGELESLDRGGRADYFKIKWTPESVRFDHKSPHVSVRGPGGELLRSESGMWERRLVVSGEEFFEYSPTEYEGVGWTAARSGSVASSIAVQRQIFLPAEIGLVPVSWGLWYTTPVQSLVPDGTVIVSDSVAPHDSDPQSRHVEFKTPSGLSGAVWLSPRRDNAVVECRVSRTLRSGSVLTQRVVNRLEQTNGIWFPTEADYTQSRDGVLKRMEHWKVTTCKINGTVEVDSFSSGRMGLKKGLAVVKEGASVLQQWDGKELIDHPPPSLVVQKRDHRRLMVLLGILLVVGAIGLIRWTLLTSRRTSG